MSANRIRVLTNGPNRHTRFVAILPVDHGTDITACGRTRIEAIRRILLIIDSIPSEVTEATQGTHQR